MKQSGGAENPAGLTGAGCSQGCVTPVTEQPALPSAPKVPKGPQKCICPAKCWVLSQAPAPELAHGEASSGSTTVPGATAGLTWHLQGTGRWQERKGRSRDVTKVLVRCYRGAFILGRAWRGKQHPKSRCRTTELKIQPQKCSCSEAKCPPYLAFHTCSLRQPAKQALGELS